MHNTWYIILVFYIEENLRENAFIAFSGLQLNSLGNIFQAKLELVSIRSSYPKVLFKIGTLSQLVKFTEKHQRWCSFSAKFQARQLY